MVNVCVELVYVLKWSANYSIISELLTMEARAKVKVRGTAGCELLRHFESVDPRAAEGLRREKPSDVPPDLDVLLEEETRRSITDAYQRLLFEVKVLHRKGNFKSSQGDVIVQRVRDIASGGKTVLDLSGFLIFDEFVELLVPYLRSKTCRLVALNLSRTSLGVQAAIDIAKATNSTLQTLQFSDSPSQLRAFELRLQIKGAWISPDMALITWTPQRSAFSLSESTRKSTKWICRGIH